ncbi:MAG: glycerophosphodiester phosphodiesterase [Clostridia bacterium]|nr:glycerophosphodiester phosphodiesterase [Clostridia bacterium]
MEKNAQEAVTLAAAKQKLAADGTLQKLPPALTVTYHAGALGTQDNSLDSIRTAVEHGAQIVEFDVSFRPDGTPVIIHALHPGADEGALLADALAIVAESADCRINLDLKSTANLPAVDKLVKEAGLFERVFYTGVSMLWARTVRRNSEIPYYLNFSNMRTRAGIAALIGLLKLTGALGLNANHGGANAAEVAALHRHGLQASFWTLNNLPDMLRILDTAPDNITTRRPDLLEALLGR